MTFYACLLSLSMFLRFLHIVAFISTSFLFYGWITFHSMYIPQLACYSFVDRHLGCFHFFTIVNSASLDVRVQLFLWVPVFNYFGYIHRSRITGDSVFNFLKKHQTVFHSSCHILHFHSARYEGSSFFTVSPTLVILHF